MFHIIECMESVTKNLPKSHSLYSYLAIHLAKILSLYFGTLQHTSQIAYLNSDMWNLSPVSSISRCSSPSLPPSYNGGADIRASVRAASSRRAAAKFRELYPGPRSTHAQRPPHSAPRSLPRWQPSSAGSAPCHCATCRELRSMRRRQSSSP